MTAEPRRLAIAIAATFTAEPADAAIAYVLGLFSIAHAIDHAGYGQLLQELIDPGGLFGQNRGGFDVGLVRLSDLGRSGHEREGSPIDGAALTRNVADLARFAKAFAQREGAPPLLVVITPERPDVAPFVAEHEATLAADLGALAGVEVIRSAELVSAYPVGERFDPEGDALGHVPYTDAFFAVIGALIARKIRAYLTPPYKVLALDCDNTLWSGVVGEDGAAGVVIDEGRSDLQRFAVEQRRSGVLVCLCSKNVEADVDEVFATRAMPLQKADVVASKVNWLPKSENLRALAAELSLGLDAFVFADDSRVECAEVRAACPEVLTVELPESSAEAAALLRRLWAFDRWKVTDEDRRRTDLYRQNVEREQSFREAPSMTEFLASLELAIDIAPPSPEQMPRVSQLTFRTNQFNATTVRRSEAELGALFASGGLEALVVEVRDRFGDYGLVGEVFYRAEGGDLVADTLLLSCRVLARGVEHRMVARLGSIARDRGLARVVIPLRFTAKNKPVQDFLRSIGRDHLTEDDGGFTVRLPADEAAALVYTPASKERAPDEGDKPRAKSPQNQASQSTSQTTLLVYAARDLVSGEAIAARVTPTVVERGRPSGAAPFVAPEGTVEETIAAIAAEVVGAREVGAHDDLFLDFGADSFAAVRIAAAIRRRLREEVTVATVLEAKTVAALAARIGSKAQGSSRRLPPAIHALRAAGTKRPIFLARPAGRTAGTLSYVALAKHLDRARPVYVFQNRPQIEGSAPYSSIEAMADEYLRAMKAIDPSGPYLLVGWCLGGKITFEIARRLAERGERPALVLLLDAEGPMRPRDKIRFFAKRMLTKAGMKALSRAPLLGRAIPKSASIAREKSLITRFGALAYWDHENDDAALVDYAFPGRFDRGSLAKMSPDAMWRAVYDALKRDLPDEVEDVEGDALAIRRGWRYFAHDHVLDASYAPIRGYSGEVHLYTIRGAKLAATWRSICAGPLIVRELDVRPTAKIPNAHNAMMQEENVMRFAPELNRLFDEAEAKVAAEAIA